MDQLEQMWSDRVAQAVGKLDEASAHAESVKEQGQEAARLARHFEQVIGLYTLDTEHTEVADVLKSLRSVKLALDTASGQDRTEGDKVSAMLNAMTQSGVDLPEEITTAAKTAVDRWAASAPKGTRSSGGRASKGQGGGTYIELKCSCGWMGHDSTGANSARWLVTSHLFKNQHSHANVTVRPGKGDADWQALTDAITPVSEKGETEGKAVLSDGTEVRVCVA